MDDDDIIIMTTRMPRTTADTAAAAGHSDSSNRRNKKSLLEFFAPTNRLDTMITGGGGGGGGNTTECLFVSELALQEQQAPASLSSSAPLETLLHAGWSFQDLVQVVADRIIWITDDTFLADPHTVWYLHARRDVVATAATAQQQHTDVVMQQYENAWFTVTCKRERKQQHRDSCSKRNEATTTSTIGIYTVGMDQAVTTLSSLLPLLTATATDEDDETALLELSLAATLQTAGARLALSAANLQLLLETHSKLRRLTFQHVQLDAAQTECILQHSGCDTLVQLEQCTLHMDTMTACLRTNQTPKQLVLRWMSFTDDAWQAFCRALAVNTTSLNTLHLVHAMRDVGQVRVFLQALQENRGLKRLKLTSGLLANDDTFGQLCQTLASINQTTLHALEIPGSPIPWRPLSTLREISRCQMLIEMLSTNKHIQEIVLGVDTDSRQWRQVQGLLFRNRYNTYRIPALARVESTTTRLGLLGRGLGAVVYEPDQAFLLLLGTLDSLLPNLEMDCS